MVERQPKKGKPNTTALGQKLQDLGFLKLSEPKLAFKVRKCMPTTLPSFDLICARDENGIFGLPFGRQIEVSGKPDSGKTTLGLQLIADAQAQGYETLLLETEHSLQYTRAEIVGADLQKTFIDSPAYLERALVQIRDAALCLPEYDCEQYRPDEGLLVVLDSLRATPPKEELALKKNDQEDDSHVAAFARRMAIFQRRMLRRFVVRNIIVVYINQPVAKIGVTMGKHSESFGGSAIRHHCSLRFETEYTGKLKDKEGRPNGITMNINNVKNKLSIPFRTVEGLEFSFSSGFNKTQSMLVALQELGLAKKNGGWYEIPALELGVNADGKPVSVQENTVREMLISDPTLWIRLRAAINAA